MYSSTIPDIQLVDRQIAIAQELADWAIHATGLDGISLAPILLWISDARDVDEAIDSIRCRRFRAQMVGSSTNRIAYDHDLTIRTRKTTELESG